MAKKDIGKILTTGSPRQRALLIAENIAKGKYGKNNILTLSEHEQLTNSFNKPNEIKVYNEFKRIDSSITNAINSLQGVTFEVLMNYSNLRGYILVWNSIENAELLVNSVLHEIKDPEERKKLAKKGTKEVDLLFSKTEIDIEGYVDIKVDFDKETYENNRLIKTKEFSLLNVMDNVKMEAEQSVIKFISWESATLDYMENKGFNVKTYKDAIGGLRAQVFSSIIGWDKYSGKLKSKLLNKPNIESIIKKYAITPNVNELEIDEIQYKWFNANIIGDEQ